jgi:predicted lysophospholipase L1 biosynthesis ABC-type transport system permease subunit
LLSATTYDSVPPGVAALRPSEVVVQAYGNGRQNAEVWRSLKPLPGVRSLAVSRTLPDGGTCRRNCVAMVQTEGRPETVELIRNAVGWRGEARTAGEVLADRTSDEPVRMVRLLQLAMLLVLLVTAANLLVSTVDGMMERRRPLAVLSAIGVPNGVVRRSIFFQVALPLCAALGLGASIGLAVTGLVFRIAKEPPVFPVAPLLLTTGLAAATVVLVTAASLPWIRIVRRPKLLRSE